MEQKYIVFSYRTRHYREETIGFFGPFDSFPEAAAFAARRSITLPNTSQRIHPLMKG